MSEAIQVRRAGRSDVGAIADFHNRCRPDLPPADERSIMLSFVENGYLIAECDTGICGMIAWRAENLIARARKMYLDMGGNESQVRAAAAGLLETLQEQASELHCEVVFLAGAEPAQIISDVAKEAGYVEVGDDALPLSWREAANELHRETDALWMKRLSDKRVRGPL